MGEISPVVFFIFNRPQKTALVFEEIRKARPKNLVIVCDGPRSGNLEDARLVGESRKIVEKIDWECTTLRDYSEKNLGLRERLLSGLDFAFQSHEEVIVLEDDCLPDPTFFQFATQLHQVHRQDAIVGTIAGSNFAPYQTGDSYHFSKSHYIWGWATWKRVWTEFRRAPQVESWSDADIEEIKGGFASQRQAREFAEMMKKAKELNTWDISFAVWLRQNGYLAAVPSRNLVENIGFGLGATHTIFEAFDVQVRRQAADFPLRSPADISWNMAVERRMWRTKMTRWVTFPLSHPFDFLRRVLDYRKARK
jgi:hypothetical protein